MLELPLVKDTLEQVLPLVKDILELERPLAKDTLEQVLPLIKDTLEQALPLVKDTQGLERPLAKDTKEQVLPLIKDIQDPEVLVHRRVKLMGLLLLQDRVMEEEDIHLAALEPEWIPRSSSGSMLWIKIEADRSTSRSFSALL